MSLLGLALLAACEGVISGRVLDAASAEPIPGARVASGARTATTSAAGEYRLDALCDGPLELVASRADYAEQRRRVTLLGSLALDLALEPRAVERLEDWVIEAPALLASDLGLGARLDDAALARARGRGLADALAELPGVEVLRSGNAAKPIVRGQSGARVLVLYDGVRHEGQDWGIDHGPELDPLLAGSMSVVKGAAGVRYGADAVGGVLLLEPHAFEGPGARGFVDLIGALNGRRGTVYGRVDHVQDGLRLRLEGDLARGAALEAPGYVLGNTGLLEWNLGARAEYEAELGTFALAYRRFDQESGLCSCAKTHSSEDFFAQAARARPIGAEHETVRYAIERPRQQLSHDTASLRATIPGALGTWIGTYAFQLDRREELDQTRRSIEGPQFDFTLVTHAADLVLEHTLFGLEGQAGVALALQDNLFAGLPLIPNYRSFGGGLFLLEQWRSEDLALEAGLRADLTARAAYLAPDAFRRHSARRSLDCATGPDSTRCDALFPALSLSLGARWRLHEALTLAADLSSASRAPSIDEQYLYGTAPSFPILAIGDPALGLETSHGLSLALIAERPWLRAELAAFASFVDDYVSLAPELGPDGPIIDVLIRGRFPRYSVRAKDTILFGGEAALSARWADLELALDASWVRARDVDGGLVAFIPADRYRARLAYAPLEALALELSASHVARQRDSDASTDLLPAPAPATLLGASASYRFELAGQRLRAAIELENALDAAYREYTSLLRYFADEPGRQLTLRLGAELGDRP